MVHLGQNDMFPTPNMAQLGKHTDGDGPSTKENKHFSVQHEQRGTVEYGRAKRLLKNPP